MRVVPFCFSLSTNFVRLFSQGGYPQQGGGFPSQGGGYPPQQGGYPPQQGGHGGHGGYPGYNPQQPAAGGFGGGYAPPPPTSGIYILFIWMIQFEMFESKMSATTSLNPFESV